MLAANDLTVRYGRVTAVHALTLHVDAGEAVGLVGPNGAGKTTTIGAVMGLVHPSAGEVRLDGEVVTGSAPERMARAGVGCVPEGRRVFASLSVAENLALGATARREPAGQEAAIERELDRFPTLRRLYRTQAGRLSGGEQQQLAIARALVSDPRLLLLDEPSLGLAPRMIDLVFETLQGLRADGVTILLVEQNAARTIEFADRTYVLRTGRLAFSGRRDELLATADLAHAYLGL